MFRARFHTQADDPRPGEWPIKYPYWITGENNRGSTLVAYVDSEEDLKRLWPEATAIDLQEREEIVFTDRFPKPDWYVLNPVEL